MAALSPTQLAALQAAAADSHKELHRTRGGYIGDGAALPFHSSRAVYGLERLGFLEYVEPPLQSRVRLTDAGVRVVSGFARVAKAIEAHDRSAVTP